MRKHLQHLLMAVALTLFCTSAAIAQSIVKGKIVDENNAPLIGATITIPGTSQGAGTDLDGSFSLKITPKTDAIEISYIGYTTVVKEINGKGGDLGSIVLEPNTVALQDVVISQSIAVQRKTPVAVSTVSADEIAFKLGTQEFPEILKSTPGVYITKDGGGYGDAKMLMRGFKQENVAVMVNGVPVNDMEWGGIYWSNWTGLSDVTRSMQTQRGLGASKISSPSVGGLVNIVTRSLDAEPGGMVSYGIGNDGRQDVSFSVSSGVTKNGWALTLFGARSWGDGYIQGTQFEGYNYFANISKRINDRHQLSLTVTGAPQKHGQRNTLYAGLNIEGWQKVKNYMKGESQYRYNAEFGYDKDGKVRHSHYNQYHKPQISLNHQWQIDHKSSLSTALYVSIGRGSGYSGQGRTSAERSAWNGASYGQLNTQFRHEDGTFGYDMIQELNEQSIDGSRMVMSKSINNHMWYGALSTYSNQITPSLELSAGIDVRYYIGTHTNEISDLYNGKYFIDDTDRGNVKAENNSAAANPNWKNEKLQVGDIVYRDYDGHVHQEGLFAQLEWTKKKFNAFISGSFSNTGYWRYDRFYYDKEHAESPHSNYLGGTVKAGINYNVTKKSNIFVNAGYISRAPYFSQGVFLSNATTHAMNPDPLNEKVASVELGYGFRSQFFQFNLNGYFTQWTDKTTVRSKQMDSGEYASLNMSGVDARHMGIELDMILRPTRWLDVTGMVSVGNWKWMSNAKGYFYNSQGQPISDINKGTTTDKIQGPDHAFMIINQKDVKVGGSAQTTANLGLNFRPMKGLRVSADWTVAANNYADFYISTSAAANSTLDVVSPWKIPWGHQIDLSASYSFGIGKCRATVYGNINNLFDYNYIMDAQCDAKAEAIWQNAYAVMYSFGRTYSVRLKLYF